MLIFYLAFTLFFHDNTGTEPLQVCYLAAFYEYMPRNSSVTCSLLKSVAIM